MDQTKIAFSTSFLQVSTGKIFLRDFLVTWLPNKNYMKNVRKNQMLIITTDISEFVTKAGNIMKQIAIMIIYRIMK